MKHFPEHDVLEQRIRKMAEPLEPPSSLSPESLLQKLPDRQPIKKPWIQLRKYAPAMAMAACLLLVLGGTAALRNFTGAPIITAEPGSSHYSEPEPSPAENSAPESQSNGETQPFSEPSSTEPPAPPASSETSLSSKQPADEPATQRQPSTDNGGPGSEQPPEPDAPEPAVPAPESGSNPDGPPGAVNLDYPGLQESESIEGYRDIYSVMEGVQRNILETPSNEADVAAYTAPYTAPLKIEGVQSGGEAVCNGDAIFSLADGADSSKVRIYEMDGKNTSLAAELSPRFELPEIEGMHTSYVALSQLLVEDDILTIVGKAYYWADNSAVQQDITVFSFYDIHQPETPVYLSSLCQDGQLSAAYIQDGVLSFITKYTVPATGSLQEENPNSYLPHAYQNGISVIPRRSQILIGEDVNAPVYTTLSAVDLTDPSVFSDIFCYLGETDGISINSSFICLARSSANTAQTFLTTFEIGANGIDILGECILPGSLLGEAHLLPKGRGIAATVVSGEGEASLYLLSKKLEIMSSMENFAPAKSVSGAEYQEACVYYYNAAGNMIAAVDCSQPKKPRSIPSASYQTGDALSAAFDGNPLDFAYHYAEDGSIDGVTLSVMGQNNAPLHSIQIDGELYIPAMYDKTALFLHEKSGLIGFAVTFYGDEASGNAVLYRYQLYQYDRENGFTLAADQLLYPEGAANLPEYQAVFLSRQNFYLVLPDKVLVLNWMDGKLLAEVGK